MTEKSGLYESVKRIMKREPRALTDSALLEGMVYEKALGGERAGRYSLRYCRDNFRRLCLPSPSEIREAAREAVAEWDES